MARFFITNEKKKKEYTTRHGVILANKCTPTLLEIHRHAYAKIFIVGDNQVEVGNKVYIDEGNEDDIPNNPLKNASFAFMSFSTAQEVSTELMYYITNNEGIIIKIEKCIKEWQYFQ